LEIHDPRQIRRLAGPAILCCLAVGAAALWMLKTATYGRGYYSIDLALYSNMFYNAAFKGRGFFTENQLLSMGYDSFLNDHFEPSLAVLAGFYRLWPSPQFLLMIPCLAYALASLLIYQISKDAFKDAGWACLGALGYWLAPLQAWLALDIPHGFHPDCLIPPLAFASVLAWQRRRPWLFWPCLALLLGLRENMPLDVAGTACACLILKKITASDAFKISLLALAFYSAAFIYGLATGRPVHSFERALAVLHGSNLSSNWALLYDWRWLASFWPALAFPLSWIPALIDMAMVLAIGESGSNWHAFPGLAALSLGWIWGLTWAQARWPAMAPPLRRALAAALALTLIFGAYKNIQIFYTGLRTTLARPARYQLSEVESLKPLIPENAILCASTDLLPRFCDREKLCWIAQWQAADWIILNLPGRAVGPGLMDGDVVAAIFAEMKKGKWALVAETGGGVLLLKKAS
jgi:hypothetical protein